MNDLIKRRRQWFEEYTQRLEQGVSKPSRPGIRYVCPCCGYPTLSERGRYDICELCNWEDDGQDDPHADEVWGGPNGRYSLSEARHNFKHNLIMYSLDKPVERIGGITNTPLEEQAKRVIIEVFEAMTAAADEQTIGELWQRVFDNEAILGNESKRKVREYEMEMKRSDSRGRP